jgi:hypothetical protein
MQAGHRLSVIASKAIHDAATAVPSPRGERPSGTT